MRVQAVRNPPATHLPKLMAEGAPLAGQPELVKYLLFELNEALLQSQAMTREDCTSTRTDTSAQRTSEQTTCSSRSRQRREATSLEFSRWASGNSQQVLELERSHWQTDVERRIGSHQRLPDWALPSQTTATVRGSEAGVTSGQMGGKSTRGLSEGEAADADMLTVEEEQDEQEEQEEEENEQEEEEEEEQEQEEEQEEEEEQKEEEEQEADTELETGERERRVPCKGPASEEDVGEGEDGEEDVNSSEDEDDWVHFLTGKLQ